ncbi:unnamed protein product, partial [Laminaria digitata]
RALTPSRSWRRGRRPFVLAADIVVCPRTAQEREGGCSCCSYFQCPILRALSFDYGIHSSRSSSSGRSSHNNGAVETQVHLRKSRRSHGGTHGGARDAHQGLESCAGG